MSVDKRRVLLALNEILGQISVHPDMMSVIIPLEGITIEIQMSGPDAVDLRILSDSLELVPLDHALVYMYDRSTGRDRFVYSRRLFLDREKPGFWAQFPLLDPKLNCVFRFNII